MVVRVTERDPSVRKRVGVDLSGSYEIDVPDGLSPAEQQDEVSSIFAEQLSLTADDYSIAIETGRSSHEP